jgi:two-component system LytT family response regulator
MIRAVLVEDELKAQKVLETLLLQECPHLDIVGRAMSVDEAKQIISAKKPDLVFMDISMPDGTGFDVLRQLDDLDFELIFVTSHNNYMMDAIRFCAIGYVLKPVEREALVEAVKNAEKRILQNKQALSNLVANLNAPGSSSNRLGIPTSDSVLFLEVDTIIRCEGMQGYTQVVCTDQSKITSSYSLGEFRNLLMPYGFLDIHKSYLINPKHIVKYDKEGMLTFIDHVTVPVSRRKRAEFLAQFNRL